MSGTLLMNALIACIVVAFMVNLAVEVEKKIFSKFPVNLLTVITSTIFTIAAAVAYISYNGIGVTVAIVIGIAAMCVAEAYIAMFGYDKFIQMVKQYKDYVGKVDSNEKK